MIEIIGVALLLFCLFISGFGLLFMAYLRERERVEKLRKLLEDRHKVL